MIYSYQDIGRKTTAISVALPTP